MAASEPSPSTGSSPFHVYFIRHAEKSDKGLELSSRGLARAKCIQSLFSAKPYRIKYILVMKPVKREDGWHRRRALDTVVPLAETLRIKVDTDCDRDDAACLANKVHAALARRDGDVLVCWEHKALSNLVKELGDQHHMKYPSKHFDIIWAYSAKDLSQVEAVTSQQCKGLDGSHLT
jgi:hypothetical protein